MVVLDHHLLVIRQCFVLSFKGHGLSLHLRVTSLCRHTVLLLVAQNIGLAVDQILAFLNASAVLGHALGTRSYIEAFITVTERPAICEKRVALVRYGHWLTLITWAIDEASKAFSYDRSELSLAVSC